MNSALGGLSAKFLGRAQVVEAPGGCCEAIRRVSSQSSAKAEGGSRVLGLLSASHFLARGYPSMLLGSFFPSLPSTEALAKAHLINTNIDTLGIAMLQNHQLVWRLCGLEVCMAG